MDVLFKLVEKGLVPDNLIEFGIRSLLKKRLATISPKDCEQESENLDKFLTVLRSSPLAVHTEKANEQHYEIPAEFYNLVLGKHKKYSGCLWDKETTSLDEAEAKMLALTVTRAEISDGQRILELGCGWGSLTLWLGEHFSKSSIVAVSNSASQREYILTEAQKRGLANIEVITCDMNTFSPEGTFDRVVSVEMFEHMRNYEELFRRISAWMRPQGKLFAHIFCHARHPYLFEVKSSNDWMSQYFFSGGIMPSANLYQHFQKDLILERQWNVNGVHYEKTARAWYANQKENKEVVLETLAKIYGEESKKLWYIRWKLFFLACAETFGYNQGNEWFVSHYLWSKR